MAQKLSDALVGKLPSPACGYKIYYDVGCAGFGVRVTAGGAKSFVLNYRIGRRERRCTIGSTDTWKVAAAPKVAREMKRKLHDKIDPLPHRDPKPLPPMYYHFLQDP